MEIEQLIENCRENGEPELPGFFGWMMRLFEDDVTPENVEQHISEYLEKLKTVFKPESLALLKPTTDNFCEQVRAFSAYQRDD
jgi:hypothetical protein